MQLNPKALGFAFGALSGGVWLIVMGISLLTGFLDQTVQAVGGLHPFFTYTWMGLIWTVVMHLVGGFIGGFILAWLYNKFNW